MAPAEPKRKAGTKRTGTLLVIGGNEDPDEDDMVILPRLVELVGGARARLLVCAAASAEPEETLGRYRAVFEKLGVKEIAALPIPERADAEADEAVEALNRATGVFFTGGDQLRIPPKIAGTAFGERLMARHREGLFVAGTSAGAAALSGTMIARGDGDTVRRDGVELAPGLALWPQSVVDTHFDRSGRVHRLLAVVAQNPGILGIGLDEDTAVEVERGERFTVVGRGTAIVFDGRVTHSSAAEAADDEPVALFDVGLHVLAPGCGFDLGAKRPFAPPDAQRPPRDG